MKIIYKIIVFTLLVNISAGLITNKTITNWEVDFNHLSESTLNSSTSSLATGVNTEKEEESLNVDSSGYSLFDNILGIITFGWYNKIMDFVKTYLYGFPKILLSILPFENNARMVILRFFNYGLTALYGFALMSFITNKSFTDGG